MAIRDYQWDPGSRLHAKCFLEQFLYGHPLYNAHAGVQRIVASDEAPAGSFEKRSIFLLGTLPPAAPTTRKEHIMWP